MNGRSSVSGHVGETQLEEALLARTLQGVSRIWPDPLILLCLQDLNADPAAMGKGRAAEMLNEHLLFPAVPDGSKQVMDKGLCLAVRAHQPSGGEMVTLKIQIAQLFVCLSW